MKTVVEETGNQYNVQTSLVGAGSNVHTHAVFSLHTYLHTIYIKNDLLSHSALPLPAMVTFTGDLLQKPQNEILINKSLQDGGEKKGIEYIHR